MDIDLDFDLNSDASDEFLGFDSQDVAAAEENLENLDLIPGSDSDESYNEHYGGNDLDDLLRTLQTNDPLTPPNNTGRVVASTSNHHVPESNTRRSTPSHPPSPMSQLSTENGYTSTIDESDNESNSSIENVSDGDIENEDGDLVLSDVDEDDNLENDPQHAIHDDIVDTNNIYGRQEEGDVMTELLQKEIDWTQNFKPIFVANFSEPTGPNLPEYFDTSTATPVDYFQLFFTDEVFDRITNNTNLYHDYRVALKKITNPNYVDKRWTPVTVPEMKAFFGLSIVMGLVSVPRYRDFWSGDDFLANPGIKKCMPVRRYEKISEVLHVSNREEEPLRGQPNADKLVKIRWLLDLVFETSRLLMHPQREQSIDEVKYNAIFVNIFKIQCTSCTT